MPKGNELRVVKIFRGTALNFIERLCQFCHSYELSHLY